MNGPLVVLGAALLTVPIGAPPRSGSDAPPVAVTEATWGRRCGAPAGNATAYVRERCADTAVCLLDVDPERLGDPAPGCEKRLEVTLACPVGAKTSARRATGASGDRLVLACADVIDVREATYGGNCGAPDGNATSHLADTCEGQPSCRYVIDFEALGDPAPGCSKSYRARWSCTGGGPAQRIEVPAEAGAKHEIALRCPVAAKQSRGAGR
ncbi:MAG: hypothetical protein CVU56_01410 [Deltaproteobacteria bacterium HGW-Deltaproteobacteria-14]|jgi:hypothetical protein|nr:MAG: hypothetical protein CVU56_01410 [Deltaproteobacteria bacterium HGW-Deltaproteobacteria-14]